MLESLQITPEQILAINNNAALEAKTYPVLLNTLLKYFRISRVI